MAVLTRLLSRRTSRATTKPNGRAVARAEVGAPLFLLHRARRVFFLARQKENGGRIPAAKGRIPRCRPHGGTSPKTIGNQLNAEQTTIEAPGRKGAHRPGGFGDGAVEREGKLLFLGLWIGFAFLLFLILIAVDKLTELLEKS